jgi:2Fe-2S ferredoxin
MKLTVYDHKGARHDLTDPKGHSVMEMIRNAGLPIAAQCGGGCSCATCHVYVDAAWIDKLPPKDEMESAMLELAEEPTDASRLSCQIAESPAIDGLIVTLAPGSDL